MDIISPKLKISTIFVCTGRVLFEVWGFNRRWVGWKAYLYRELWIDGLDVCTCVLHHVS